ncbi:BREX system ATP-binding domain-containing protein [Micromonospora sp. NPDC023966]|uniref:BREX system ATP-binding domain-containing protein n=1 Tax=Micromonospora sp. NPDC023966 TaxID=3154699 RepID=UPI0033F570DC
MRSAPRRRREIIDALRRGTVPQQGLDIMAVGRGRFEAAIDDELEAVTQGGAQFKAVRGDDGSGKTFFSRWLTERAKKRNFATAEVQICETETPLYKLEKVYRRIVENFSTPGVSSGALSDVVDGWLYVLGQDECALHELHAERVSLELDQLRLFLGTGGHGTRPVDDHMLQVCSTGRRNGSPHRWARQGTPGHSWVSAGR